MCFKVDKIYVLTSKIIKHEDKEFYDFQFITYVQYCM